MGLLDGRVVLVTGGGRGIGRECAILSAQHGACVIVNDAGVALDGEGGDRRPAEEVAEVIRAAGGEAVANTEDVTDLGAVGRMVQQAMDSFGALHVVTNLAGFLRDCRIHEMSEQDWDAIIEVHLRGHFNVVRATIDHFLTQKGGTYVMWSSNSGLIGNAGQAAYGAAKMGVAGLSRIVALEGASHNVRSNAIVPQAATRMTDPWMRSEETAKRFRLSNPPVRPAQLSVALSSEASKDVSGQIFGADGDALSVFSQPRPIERYAREGGWTAEAIIADFLPRAEKLFTPLGAYVPSVPIPVPVKS